MKKYLLIPLLLFAPFLASASEEELICENMDSVYKVMYERVAALYKNAQETIEAYERKEESYNQRFDALDEEINQLLFEKRKLQKKVKRLKAKQ